MATNPSPALLAAQEKLLSLRQQLAPSGPHRTAPLPTPPPSDQATPLWPAHLGWHSEPLRLALPKSPEIPLPQNQTWALPIGNSGRSSPDQPSRNPLQAAAGSQRSIVSGQISLNRLNQAQNLTLYPDLAMALLQQNRTAESRVWLLLRHLDEAGQGWLTMQVIRQLLAEASSPWKVCGWRQLRILLAQGDGLFWQRQGERLWLRSMVKVAAALGLTHLSGHPVTLPARLLTRPIGEVKAHFYASFHSGRNHEHQPIARATLAQLSGLSPQTQRHYEKRAGVRPQSNYALGEIVTPEYQEDRSWQQGNGTFIFNDVNGLQGAAGTRYLAWQLPNEYSGPHLRQPKGRQKRLNRRLADLRQQGTAGNDRRHKRFFANGCAAVTGQQGSEVYWRGRERVNGGQIWYLLAKSGGD